MEQYRDHEPSRESIELALDSILQVGCAGLFTFVLHFSQNTSARAA